MNYRRILLVVMVLTLIVSAAEKATIRIKILDSETHSVVIDNSGVPKNCDQVNFDAYCNNSKTTQVTNTMLVQEGDQAPYRVSCTVDSKWSRCTPLPSGETFEARRQKRGLLVYYIDDKGKARSQLYTLVAGKMPVVTTAAAQPLPASSPQPSTAVRSTVPGVSASTPASAPATATSAQLSAAEESTIKCNFSSTPSGAEITIDGKYVGSTPSEIAVSTGTHVVTFSLPGFAEWKRDLAVSPGSQLTVSAILQKQ